ncbi:MAG: hypothetical protein EP318_13530 [Rhodobacteraceae bacterium]|nr:MAG: hypothetical protein EP318_13530 [Paracoccaceae bacterium]
MTGINNTLSFDPQNRFRPGTRPRVRVPLPVADHQQLQRHLEHCEQVTDPVSNLLAYVLRDKIMMTEPVGNLHARDLVTGGSCVTYSINRGEGQTGLLAHRARSGSGISVIPVASLLGATLIGMRVGQRSPLLCEDGTILSVSVLDVTPPN